MRTGMTTRSTMSPFSSDDDRSLAAAVGSIGGPPRTENILVQYALENSFFETTVVCAFLSVIPKMSFGREHYHSLETVRAIDAHCCSACRHCRCYGRVR